MKIGFKLKGGTIIPALSKWCDKLSALFKKSAFFSLITGYDKSNKAFADSTIRKAVSSTASDNKGIVRRFKRAISAQFENSLLINIVSALSQRLQTMPLKIYGMFFASFGIYTIIIYLLKTFALLFDSVAISDLWGGVIICAISIPMLFSTRCLAKAMGESRLMRPILTGIFGISPVSFEKSSVEVRYHSISVIAGIVFGALTFFVSPFYVLTGIATVAVLWLLMSYPEAGVVISLAMVPFMGMVEHPSLTLAVMVMLTLFSYGIKLLRGKRIISFEIIDLFVFFFCIVIALSGITPGGHSGVKEALVSAGLMLIYFLVSNLVRSRTWINITLALCIASATITSFIGIAEFIWGFAKLDWIDSSMFSGITGRATSVFENPNVLSSYLILIIPVTIAVCIYHKKRNVKLLCAICAAIMTWCVVLTWSRGAWLGLAVSVFLLLVSASAKNLLLLPPAASALLIASWAFPDTFGARVGNIFTVVDSSNHYRVSIWRGVGNMLRESWACGIGAGELNFRAAYINFASFGIENAPHAHSLYLQLLIQVGVMGLVFLFGALLLSAQKVYSHNLDSRADKSTGLIAVGCFCGVAAMLVFGLFDYTWYNYRILFTFWAFLGLASAAVNVGREDIRLNETATTAHSTTTGECAELVINFRKEQP